MHFNSVNPVAQEINRWERKIPARPFTAGTDKFGGVVLPELIILQRALVTNTA